MTDMFLPVAHHASACYVRVPGVIKLICIVQLDEVLFLTVSARRRLQSSCFLTCLSLHVHSLPKQGCIAFEW